jgi:hypothetical protein
LEIAGAKKDDIRVSLADRSEKMSEQMAVINGYASYVRMFALSDRGSLRSVCHPDGWLVGIIGWLAYYHYITLYGELE